MQNFSRALSLFALLSAGLMTFAHAAPLKNGLRLGIVVDGGQNWSSVEYSSTSSRGHNLGAGGQIGWYGTNFHLVGLLAFRSYSLSRVLSVSIGGVIEPSSYEVTQNEKSLGLGVLGGVKLFRPREAHYGVWWQLGAEALFPLSASQTDSLGVRRSFDPRGPVVFFVTGPAMDFRLTPLLLAGGATHFTFQYASSGVLFGGRLQLAFGFQLL